MTALQELLTSYRQASRTEREKGNYFELLIKDFLKHDPTYSPNFSDVWTFAD
jgi:predicted helicase